MESKSAKLKEELKEFYQYIKNFYQGYLIPLLKDDFCDSNGLGSYTGCQLYYQFCTRLTYNTPPIMFYTFTHFISDVGFGYCFWRAREFLSGPKPHYAYHLSSNSRARLQQLYNSFFPSFFTYMEAMDDGTIELTKDNFNIALGSLMSFYLNMSMIVRDGYFCDDDIFNYQCQDYECHEINKIRDNSWYNEFREDIGKTCNRLYNYPDKLVDGSYSDTSQDFATLQNKLQSLNLNPNDDLNYQQDQCNNNYQNNNVIQNYNQYSNYNQYYNQNNVQNYQQQYNNNIYQNNNVIQNDNAYGVQAINEMQDEFNQAGDEKAKYAYCCKKYFECGKTYSYVKKIYQYCIQTNDAVSLPLLYQILLDNQNTLFNLYEIMDEYDKANNRLLFNNSFRKELKSDCEEHAELLNTISQAIDQNANSNYISNANNNNYQNNNNVIQNYNQYYNQNDVQDYPQQNVSYPNNNLYYNQNNVQDYQQDQCNNNYQNNNAIQNDNQYYIPNFNQGYQMPYNNNYQNPPVIPATPQLNDNIQLFSSSAGGGNTCWLQSALVLFQGENNYKQAIKTYLDKYKNKEIISYDDYTVKLIKSINNFLKKPSNKTLKTISQKYQNYIKYNHKESSNETKKDVDVSIGSPYDSTTFLACIDCILGEKNNFKNKTPCLKTEPFDYVVMYNGKTQGRTYPLDCYKYILSYISPNHWITYKKDGDNNEYIEYDTRNPNARQKYTVQDIKNKAKNVILAPPGLQIQQPLFGNVYKQKKNGIYPPIYPQTYQPLPIKNPSLAPIAQRTKKGYPFPQFQPGNPQIQPDNHQIQDDDSVQQSDEEEEAPSSNQEAPSSNQEEPSTTLNFQPYIPYNYNAQNDYDYEDDSNSDNEEETYHLSGIQQEKPPEPAYTTGQKVVMILAYLAGILPGLIIHFLFYKKFKEPQELAVENYEKQQKSIKNAQSISNTNTINSYQTQGNSK